MQKSKRIKTKCDYCSKELEMTVSAYNAKKHHFCDRACWLLWKRRLQVEITCEWCGKKRMRKPSLVRAHNYCDQKCWGKHKTEKALVMIVCPICHHQARVTQAKFNLNTKAGQRITCGRPVCYKKAAATSRSLKLLDDYSPYRGDYNRLKHSAKARKLRFEITLDDMKDLYEAQAGLCAKTGWEIPLPRCSTDLNLYGKSPQSASLDRIDSRGHYTKDNVQWVAWQYNASKFYWDEGIIEPFGKAVIAYKAPWYKRLLLAFL